ncbi:MAG: 50S ribosomal protein L21 [Myxococcota bacterium]|jgi:large subunit ribosomal protein L21|nr:50S ribosomal protein L21 [Myxococcota bacterium]
MYAVVKTGGKQVRVEPGARVRVEQLPGDVGSSIELDQVLLVGGGDDALQIGTPVVEGARVSGTITAQGRHPKIRVFKMKRRKGYRRLQGHRQSYTEIQVDSIDA